MILVTSRRGTRRSDRWGTGARYPTMYPYIDNDCWQRCRWSIDIFAKCSVISFPLHRQNKRGYLGVIYSRQRLFLIRVGVLGWFMTSQPVSRSEPRLQRKVILVWLEPITYFRLQQTCPGTSWRSTRTSSHFSTGVCIYIFLSTDWNIEIEEQTVFNWRDGSGSISSSELGQVMRTFGWSPSEMELQVLCSQIYLDTPSSRLVSCNVLMMHNCTCRSLSVK